MDPVAATHAAILTMEKTVNQNAYVMRRDVILSRGVNKKVILIYEFVNLKFIEPIYRDTKNKSENKVMFIPRIIFF